MRRPGRKDQRTIALEAKASSVLDLEDFVDGLGFLSGLERDRLKLAGGEILDNIVKHASPIDHCMIYIRAKRRDDSILLGFYFRAPGFGAFVGSDWPQAAAAEPLFDPTNRRWRGIGLAMCQNLARKVVFRPGKGMDRIFLEFTPSGQRGAHTI